MASKHIIPVDQFCLNYNIEQSFIHALMEYGLTEITIVEENQYIYEDKIRDLERMMRMHYDLDINLEGIEAISHLLDRVISLQEELTALKNRLRFYEGEE